MTGRDLFDATMRAARRHQAPPPPSPLPRLHRPSLDTFRAYRRYRMPVRLDGLIGEKELADWTLSQLRARYADRILSVIPTTDGRLISDPRNGVQFSAVRFGDYLDQVERGDRRTYLATPASTWLPEVTQALPPPEYCRDAPFLISRFWVSAPGTSAPLHRDVAQNIYFQLVGRKRFLLYPPTATPWLYSYGFRSGLPNYSRFDPEAPDYDRFPLSRRVEPLEIVLEPGDAFYLPSLWWHQVRSLDTSVSLNYWWAYGTLALIVRAAEFVKRIRGLEIYGLEARLRANGNGASSYRPAPPSAG